MADESASAAESPLAEKDILERIKQWFKQARNHSSTWREEAREDFDFAAGEQYTAADKQRLKETMRPAIVYNRIQPTIDSVSGTEVNNRQEVRYIPREMGDVQVNEVLTGAAQWIRDQADADEEESDAFVDMLIGGMGWTESRLDYDDDPAGMVRVDRTDPFEMYWDGTARKKNLEDARFVIRLKRVDIADARAMFPDAGDEMLDASWASDLPDEGPLEHDRELARSYGNQQVPGTKVPGMVKLVECQWWEYQTAYAVANPMTGEIERLTAEEYAKVRDRLGDVPAEKQRMRVYRRAFCGKELLEEGPAPCPDHFTYQCMTGKRDRNRRLWYGLVRSMKDPQRWANTFMGAVLHIVQTSGKGIGVETDAVDDPRVFEEDFAKPDAIKWFKSGALAGGKIFPIPGQQLPAGLPDLMIQAISAIRDVTGVNLEMLGLAEKQQAGVLEYQRRQAGMTILAGLFDSMRRYRKEQGRVLLYYITERLSDGRLIRIVGSEGMKYVPLVRQEGIAKYDVIVDDAPSSPNQKEVVWQLISQMFPLLMKVPVPPQVWVEVVKYSPLPSTVAEKIGAALSQPQAPNPEMQLKQAEMQHEIQKMGLERQIKGEEAQVKHAESQQRMQEVQLKGQIDMARLDKQMQATAAQSQQQQQAAQFQMAATDKQTGVVSDSIAAALVQGMAQQSEILAQGMAQQTAVLAQGGAAQTAALATGMQQLAQAVVTALSQPKKIVRDGQGRAMSVEVMSAQGNA